VLDRSGATLPRLDPAAVARLIHDRTATAGMIAKLRACAHALAHGVTDVVITDGRDRDALEAAALADNSAQTTTLIGEPAGAPETGR
jgi:acetylglutamate kinase